MPHPRDFSNGELTNNKNNITHTKEENKDRWRLTLCLSRAFSNCVYASSLYTQTADNISKTILRGSVLTRSTPARKQQTTMSVLASVDLWLPTDASLTTIHLWIQLSTITSIPSSYHQSPTIFSYHIYFPMHTISVIIFILQLFISKMEVTLPRTNDIHMY